MDREKVIKDIEYAKDLLQHRPEQDTVDYKVWEVLDDALDLINDLRSQIAMLVGAQHELCEMLKEQDEEHRRLLSWLGKFCRHIDNGDAWLTDEENIAFFKEKMKQQFGWDTD